MTDIDKRVDVLEQELKQLKEVLDKMIYREKILERNRWLNPSNWADLINQDNKS